jgi:hypothetical protein
MRLYLLISCILLLSSPGCNLPPLAGSAEACSPPHSTEARRTDETANPPPASPPSSGYQVEPGGADIPRGLYAVYSGFCKRIELIVHYGVVDVLLLPVGFLFCLILRGGSA